MALSMSDRSLLQRVACSPINYWAAMVTDVVAAAVLAWLGAVWYSGPPIIEDFYQNAYGVAPGPGSLAFSRAPDTYDKTPGGYNYLKLNGNTGANFAVTDSDILGMMLCLISQGCALSYRGDVAAAQNVGRAAMTARAELDVVLELAAATVVALAAVSRGARDRAARTREEMAQHQLRDVLDKQKAAIQRLEHELEQDFR